MKPFFNYAEVALAGILSARKPDEVSASFWSPMRLDEPELPINATRHFCE